MDELLSNIAQNGLFFPYYCKDRRDMLTFNIRNNIWLLIFFITLNIVVCPAIAKQKVDNARVKELVEQGVKFGLEKKYDDAKVFLEEALKLDPNNADIYFELGYIYEVSGNLRKALDLYQKSIKLNPKNAKVYYNLGNIYFVLGLHEKAIFEYKKAVKFDSNYVEALYNLSVASFGEEQFKDAIKYYDKAIKLGIKTDPKYLEELKKYR